jgi:hypothetical protein
MKLAIIALGALLAGCSVAPAQPPIQTSAQALSVGRAPRTLLGPSGSTLLYLSAYNAVDVYDYATSTKVASISGFDHASGSCTDAQGNVFITNTGDADILKFSHGGTKPSYIIDPYPDPVDCSIDPSTGNLAVVNEYGTSDSSPGNVAVYTAAKGKPKIFKSSFATQLLAATYDAKGDLLVSGAQDNVVSFALLSAGASKLETVSLPHSEGSFSPWVRWDGEYFVVELENFSGTPLFVMYTLNGSSGIEEGYMQVTETAEGPFWLGIVGGPKGRRRANQLVGTFGDSGVLIYDYPEGGFSIFRLNEEDQYGGVTVSSK